MELKNMVKAWDKERNQMCNVVFIDFIKPQIGLHCVGYGSYCQHPNDVIILRNTGFKDKNGKEVYEGDICKDVRCTLSILWSDKHQWGCKIIKGGVLTRGLTFPLWQWDGTLDKVTDRMVEVIGNIYENKELMGDKTDGEM